MEVREFRVDELETYLRIRRNALTMNPEAFGDSIEKMDAREPAENDERFYKSVASPDRSLVGAFHHQLCVGMAGLQRETQMGFQHRAFVWGVFVDPSARGQKLGERLIQALLNIASQWQGLSEVVLSVKSKNESAIRVYERIGMEIFQPDANDPLHKGPLGGESHMVWSMPPAPEIAGLLDNG